jgi:Cu/Ag efflux pump CusA
MGTVIWTLFKRWAFTVMLGWIVTLVVALVASPFAWWSWNHGIVRAFNVPVIDWVTAYYMTLLLAMVTGMLKSSLVVNTREEQ